MKFLAALFISGLPSVIAMGGAVYLAYLQTSGWGWFLLASLCCAVSNFKIGKGERGDD